jgi:IclR family acetate operon transcriptional repressor
VANALRVLKSFSSAQRDWGVSDLARHLHLGKSTVHRLLTTLVEERMLEQDIYSGRYRLGLAVFDLAAAVPTQLDLHEAVLSPMTDLRNASGETVQVAVLDGREVVYVERLDSPHTLRMFLEIGRRNHAHSTATGKCLMAFLPKAQLDRLLKGWELPPVTPYTLTDHRRLREDLDAIRYRGYAENRHETDLGAVSVAAPIRGANGEVMAALSVAGPEERVDSVRLNLAHATMQTAALISRRLGYRGAA